MRRNEDILGGKVMTIRILKVARIIAKGSHKKRANVARGVGKNANLPSWKMRGFGYFSLANIVVGLVSLSSLLTTYAS